MSVISTTLVGPSVVIHTDKKPEPGLNFCLQIACSNGTPESVTCKLVDAIGPNTTSFPTKIINIKPHFFKNSLEKNINTTCTFS